MIRAALAGAGLVAAMLGLVPLPALAGPPPALGPRPDASPTAPDAGPAADPEGEDAEQLGGVAISMLSPVSAQPGGQLLLAGTVTNRSQEPLTGVQALLRLSRDRLESRADVSRVAGDPEFRRGLRVDSVFQPLVDELPPGGSVAFRLAAELDRLGLGEPGVYVVGVDVRASRLTGERTTIAEDRTLLPWRIETDRRVPVALLWPLSARPALLTSQRLLGDDLAEDLASDGGLRTLLEAPGDAPVTWLLDPDLLRTVEEMADGYTVTDGTGKVATPGTGQAAAQAWRDAAVSRLAGPGQRPGQLVLLPVADPDVNGLVDLGDAGQRVLGRVIGQAGAMASASLGPQAQQDRPLPVLAWPLDGLPDAGTLGGLREAGVDGVLVGGSTGTARATATTAAGPPLTVLDAGLSAALRPGDEPAPALAVRQRLLAETALAALDGSADSVLVAAPDRRWRPNPATAAAVIAGWRAPWVQPVTLEQARTTGATASVEVPEEAGPRLRRQQLQAVAGSERSRQRLRSATLEDHEALRRLDDAVDRLASTAWRYAPKAAAAMQARTSASLVWRTAQLRVLAAETVVLSGDSGRFPLTVANDLPVTARVRVRVIPESSERLRVTGVPQIEVAAGAKETVTISAEAAANGRLPVSVQLLTPGGEPLGRPRRVIVVATDYGVVGWVVIAVAGTLLAGTATLRTVRRVRARTSQPQPQDERVGSVR